jgi:hypothetical protein
MRFCTLLIHRCSLHTRRRTGQDPYGRDITGSIETMNVPCRFDNVRARAVTDVKCTDFIYENIMYLDSREEIDLTSTLHNIIDEKGVLILEGSFSIVNILPIYNRSKLHHYEVAVKRM